MKRLFQRFFDKSRSFRDKMDQYQESITFAEAGEADYAAASFQTEQVEAQPGILLVIGNEDTFSKQIIDYGIEMAQRMAYRIVALNMAPVPEAAFRMFAPSRNKIEEFEQAAQQNAASFKKAAEDLGIPFTHVVKFGETDQVIDEIRKEYGEVEFVVSEPREEQASKRPSEENRPEKQLYVYTMV